ncbi:MAG: enoyl-ACP reductase [Bdellovibrionales bacterium]
MRSLKAKKILIFGVANDKSLAWHIAKDLKSWGAELAFNYLNEKMEKRVRPLAESVDAEIILPCDVSKPEEIQSFFKTIEEKWGKIDGVVHAVAYADREDLMGRFIDTSKEGFLKAMEISAYSLVEVVKHAEPMMKDGGSIVTLSYQGAVRVVPNYNVMGVAKAALEATVRYMASDLGPQKITVNSISAGPIKTLSAAGIRDFRSMLSEAEEKVPMRENISGESVGSLASFLLSSEAKHVTGTTMYVDSGANIMA